MVSKHGHLNIFHASLTSKNRPRLWDIPISAIKPCLMVWPGIPTLRRKLLDAKPVLHHILQNQKKISHFKFLWVSVEIPSLVQSIHAFILESCPLLITKYMYSLQMPAYFTKYFLYSSMISTIWQGIHAFFKGTHFIITKCFLHSLKCDNVFLHF